MSERTVYIVDDNREFLESAKWWLEGAGYEVRDFDSPLVAIDALALAPAQSVLLLDVRMPDMSGLTMHDQLRERGIRIPVIYMTGHGDVPLAVEAMRKGAVTFIEKPFAEESLQRALDLAFDPAESADDAARQFAASAEAQDPVFLAELAEHNARFARLTARERQVVGLVMQEKRNKVIADRLNISIKTVELHRKNAMTKLGARSVIELTRVMVQLQVA